MSYFKIATGRIQLFLMLAFLFTPTKPCFSSNEYIIYSIGQDFPMGYKEEKLKKNYYVNLGQIQGLKEGTLLDVYRIISQIDPYNNSKRYNFRVKIGELKIIHTENESAIAMLNNMKIDDESPHVDIKGFMIGDIVDIHLK